MYLKINLESAYNEKNIHVKKYFFVIFIIYKVVKR